MTVRGRSSGFSGFLRLLWIANLPKDATGVRGRSAPVNLCLLKSRQFFVSW